MARQGRHGLTRRDVAGTGKVGYAVRQGSEWRGRLVKARRGATGLGRAWLGRRGAVGPGLARPGTKGHGTGKRSTSVGRFHFWRVVFPAPVAQMDRATVFRMVGHGFESRRGRLTCAHVCTLY